MLTCMTISTDPVLTAERFANLETYFDREVLTTQGEFVCTSAKSCAASAFAKPNASFHVAQGTAVSPHYDTFFDGHPLRVLVVPMETGRERERVQLAERTDEVRALIDRPWKSWNPHMKGVGSALRLAFGIPLGDDDAGLLLDTESGPVHVLDAYAMANIALCSAIETGSTESRSTSVIRTNCLRHLVATIDVLQPTMVISQGARLTSPLTKRFKIVESHSPNLATCELNGGTFIWANLHHPTRHWEHLSRPYLTEVVEPTIIEARTRALGLS